MRGTPVRGRATHNHLPIFFAYKLFCDPSDFGLTRVLENYLSILSHKPTNLWVILCSISAHIIFVYITELTGMKLAEFFETRKAFLILLVSWVDGKLRKV